VRKKKWLGALLNFLLPGLGYAYNREIRKGVLAYILLLVVILIPRLVAYNFSMYLFSVMLIVNYYLYVIIDGYRSVQSGRAFEPRKMDNGLFTFWYFFFKGF